MTPSLRDWVTSPRISWVTAPSLHRPTFRGEVSTPPEVTQTRSTGEVTGRLQGQPPAVASCGQLWPAGKGVGLFSQVCKPGYMPPRTAFVRHLGASTALTGLPTVEFQNPCLQILQLLLEICLASGLGKANRWPSLRCRMSVPPRCGRRCFGGESPSFGFLRWLAASHSSLDPTWLGIGIQGKDGEVVKSA